MSEVVKLRTEAECARFDTNARARGASDKGSAAKEAGRKGEEGAPEGWARVALLPHTQERSHKERLQQTCSHSHGARHSTQAQRVTLCGGGRPVAQACTVFNVW